MERKTRLIYADGSVAEFINGDPLELDLDSPTAHEIFSIEVSVDGKAVFQAFHWRNEPVKINQI